jgi:NUMOD3 motif
MNYQKIYNNLISRANSRIVEDYVEKHHIIPRCLGGTDSKENIVNLYPEEHYLAHLLLCKLKQRTPNKGMLGRTMSEETRAKMSASQQGKKMSEEAKAKMRIAAKIREAKKREKILN